MTNNRQAKIFLATGGSGGHIMPAISVAKKLTEENYNICILGDEIYKKYSSCNLNYRIIPAGKTLKSFTDLKKIAIGIMSARSFIAKEKPNLVVSFGSYATLPTLIACILTKTPFIIHEQNAYIGKINKLFAKYAKQVMTTYYELYGLKFTDMNKVVYTGSPVRKEIKELYNIPYKYPEPEEKFVVLITGGSGGAQLFSEYLPKIFNNTYLKEEKKLKIYHQVREEYVNKVKTHYSLLNIDATVQSFFPNMSELLAKSHLVIGRAGSGTLCETAIAGKPSIIIPLSSRANNRQIDNAKSFVRQDASILVLEKDFSIKSFQELFFNTIKDKEKLETIANNVRKLAVPDADVNIVNIIKNNL